MNCDSYLSILLKVDVIYVDLTSTFAQGQAYVAISRVKRLKNLHFIGWDRRIFKLQNVKLIQVMNSLNIFNIIKAIFLKFIKFIKYIHN